MNLNRRSFFLQQVVINTDSQLIKVQRLSDGITALNRTSIACPFPMRNHRIITEEKGRKTSKSNSRKLLQNRAFHSSQRHRRHELTVAVTTHIGPVQDEVNHDSQHRWVRRSWSFIPSWGATRVNGWWEGKNIRFLWISLLIDCPSSSWWPYAHSFTGNTKWTQWVFKRSQGAGETAQQLKGGLQPSATPV